MTNASDGFFSGGQALNYGPTTDTRWLGRPRGGRIISEPREEQQTDINTRLPLFWDEGRTRPKMQLVFTVVCDGSGPAAQNGWSTDERVDQADQGHRSVYIKGKDKTDAIKGQLQQHGRPGLRVGDHYYECWTGTRPGQNNIGTARTWAVMLFPGAGQAQQQFFGNEQQPAAPSGFGQPQAPGPSANTPAQGAQQWGAPPQQPQHVPAWSDVPAGAAANPGPPPQFGAPAPQPAAANGFGQAPPQYAPAPSGFGAPPAAAQSQQEPPPVNPWGQAPPASNPYAG